MTEGNYLTAAGEARLREELEQLRGPARDDLARRLRFAIQQGDLSENADYTAAKEEQGFLEGRIQELERILGNVIIIPEGGRVSDKVEIGTKVSVQEDDFPEETYFVVGPKEADPRNGRISHESPIGKALLGHKVGETVTFSTPGGSVTMRIVHIG